MDNLAPDWAIAVSLALLFIAGYALGRGEQAREWWERAEGLWLSMWEEVDHDD